MYALTMGRISGAVNSPLGGFSTSPNGLVTAGGGLRLQGGDENPQALLELLVGDGQRRDQPQDVLARAAQQDDEAVVEAAALHRLGGGLVAQLHADHQPDAP